MILYLKDDTESEKSLLHKYIYKNNVMNQFQLHYCADFLKHIHIKYKHLEVLRLLKVI